jgi:hypothetical protein
VKRRSNERQQEQAAIRFVMEEQQARWQAALAAGGKPDVLACRWLLIYAESYAKGIRDGWMSIGEALDQMRHHGHQLPPEVAPVHAAWLVAEDLMRPYWDRHTPEGRKAAEAERLEAETKRREAKKAARRFRRRVKALADPKTCELLKANPKLTLDEAVNLWWKQKGGAT